MLNPKLAMKIQILKTREKIEENKKEDRPVIYTQHQCKEGKIIYLNCFFRTLDDDVYDLTIALAKRYELPLWEVYMAHIDFLFSESG